VPATQSNTVLLVEARLSPLQISSFLRTVLVLIGDSSLAFASKESYILLVVYSSGSTGCSSHCLPHLRIASKHPSSSTLRSLLGQYSDVFPDELPNGLPPEQTVELKMKLVADSKPVKRPIYKLSTAELKEVKTQIDDLPEKGFIRPSTGPWVSSILFVPKRTVDSVYELTIGPSIKLQFETIIRFLG
jgi:hypothetical protein